MLIFSSLQEFELWTITCYLL